MMAPRPVDMTMRSCELDVRTGGKYRLVFGGAMRGSRESSR